MSKLVEQAFQKLRDTPNEELYKLTRFEWVAGQSREWQSGARIPRNIEEVLLTQHKDMVYRAYDQGLPIPLTVMAEYPELLAQELAKPDVVIIEKCDVMAHSEKYDENPEAIEQDKDDEIWTEYGSWDSLEDALRAFITAINVEEIDTVNVFYRLKFNGKISTCGAR